MKRFWLIAAICGALTVDGFAGEFWHVGRLAGADASFSGEAQVKHVLLENRGGKVVSGTGISNAGAEPDKAVPLRVVDGWYARKLAFPNVQIRNDNIISDPVPEYLLRSWVSLAGGAFHSTGGDELIAMVGGGTHKTLTGKVQCRITGATCVDQTLPSGGFPMFVGQRYRIVSRWNESRGPVIEATDWFECFSAASAKPDPSKVLVVAGVTIRPGKAAVQMTRVPFVRNPNGKLTVDFGTLMQSGNGSTITITATRAGQEEFGAPRAWTNAQGKSIQATLLLSSAGAVVLKLASGDLVVLALNDLSPADQAWVQSAKRFRLP